MQLQVFIKGACLTTFVDLSSTHNFIDANAAAWVGVTFHV
jgi:hypothetical protein